MGPKRIGVASGPRRLVVAVVVIVGLGAALGLSVAGSAGGTVLAPNISASLISVSCPSPGFCMAVGQVNSELEGVGQVNGRALAVRWAGGRWSTVIVPQPAPEPGAVGAFNPVLTSVSCSSPSACTAVGTYFDEISAIPGLVGAGSGVEDSFAERWNGSQWSLQTTWNEPLADSFLDTYLSGVACTSARACVSVGTVSNNNEGEKAESRVVERWNGRSWSLVETPELESNTSLGEVSCSSARACTAVGVRATSEDNNVPFVQRWNGSRWRTQRPPKVASLDGFSCPGRDSCTAVGSRDAYRRAGGLAGRWDGRRWTVQPVPALVPGNGSGSVSCPKVTECVSVGFVGQVSHAPVSEIFNGVRWKTRRISRPAGLYVWLNSVSCASSSDCAAVGGVSPGRSPFSGEEAILAERWNGRAWTIEQTPDEPGTS